jgi:RNA polymerase II-associated protein 3
MDRSVAEAIRQQSEDLRDELRELEQWEDAVKAKEAAKAQRKTTQTAKIAAVVPPIRGTVPSLKEAVRQQQAANSSSVGAAKAAADPIQEAKERGNALFQAGRLQEAVAAYTIGIDLDPASSTTHVLYANRSMCYLKLGQWSAAEKDATTCVQMNTSYAKAYYRRAMARKNLHKLKEARADLEAVLALAPKDVSAQHEMVEVTKALQAERTTAAATSAPAAASTKKRIIIEEVDSEGDEVDGGAEVAPLVTKAGISAEEQQMRQTRIDEDMKKLAAARAQYESQTRLEAQREAQAQAQRQRRNQRVEIVEEEDEEDVAGKATQSPPSPSSQPAEPTSTQLTAAAPSAQETEAAKSAPRAPSSPPTSKSSSVSPRPRPAVSKESLTTPKSFTEFERRFREVEPVPELRNYYVSLLNPAGMSKLFGSNMTPEMLLGILESIKTFSGTIALQFAKGLCQVNRVEDMTFFFNAKEKAVVQEVLDLLKSSGASLKDIQSIQRKLKPF